MTTSAEPAGAPPPPPLPESHRGDGGRASRGKKRSIIVGCIAVGVLALIGTVAVFAFLGEELPVTERDHEVLLLPADFMPFFEDWEPVESATRLSKRRNFDGSYELEMEYDSTEDIDQPYLYVMLSHTGSPTEAVTTFHSIWTGTKIGLSFAEGDNEIESQSSIYRYGDESKFAFIVDEDGESYGNLFVTRIGVDVVYLLMSGFLIEDGETFGAMIEPKLDALAGFDWD